jgi:hypothetical protein
MIVNIPFEHYVMFKGKRYEPRSVEWDVKEDILYIRGDFNDVIQEHSPDLESVVQTPWGRYSRKMTIYGYEPSMKDQLFITHRFSNDKDTADWWKNED